MAGIGGWLQRIGDCLIPPEPPVPTTVLGSYTDRFSSLSEHQTVCIKVAAAQRHAYPFAVSGGFIRRVVEEIRDVNPGVRLILTEGGVGVVPVDEAASIHRLTDIPGVEFVDAEDGDGVFVPNPLDRPNAADGFWLPSHWVDADVRMLVTTCKLRSHHFQQLYSGGVRNLIGLLPRARYRLPSSRRQMRSMVHQRGVDATVADLYATTGQGLITVLDGRLVARQDEHLPLRFVRRTGRIVVADDPYEADAEMAHNLRLASTPAYLNLIERSKADGLAARVR